MMDQEFRLIAPDVKRLLGCYERIMNPEQPSAALMEALDPLIRAMADLAPFPKSNESKGIWITVPRGEITDWGDFEEAKADGDVESYEEFESLWRLYYPLETMRNLNRFGVSTTRLKQNGILFALPKTSLIPG